MSVQLSSGDTHQIWKWLFMQNKKFIDEEIKEWSFSNPHPRYGALESINHWPKSQAHIQKTRWSNIFITTIVP